MKILPSVSLEARQFRPSVSDIVAAGLVVGFIVIFAQASRNLGQPLSTASPTQFQMGIAYLPGYALRTGLRMLIAMGFSLAFTFTYATWAAKNARAEKLLIPLLDLLQSLPVLSFISVTIVFFLSLAPGRVFGAELVAVFAIFTNQAWNMAFSFYQSLRTVPEELIEAGKVFGLTPWTRFWRIEVPFAMPALIWNMMMSMSGSWFLLTASEAFSVGNTTIALPGIGSYIATAIAAQNLKAMFYAIAAMAIVILGYDQIIFRPLVTWAERFKIGDDNPEYVPESLLFKLYQRARLFRFFTALWARLMRWTYRLKLSTHSKARVQRSPAYQGAVDVCWYAFFGAAAIYSLRKLLQFWGGSISWNEIKTVVGLGTITLLRVLILIGLASIIWTPIGVYIGLRPRLRRIIQPVAQFLSAFPRRICFSLSWCR